MNLPITKLRWMPSLTMEWRVDVHSVCVAIPSTSQSSTLLSVHPHLFLEAASLHPSTLFGTYHSCFAYSPSLLQYIIPCLAPKKTSIRKPISQCIVRVHT